MHAPPTRRLSRVLDDSNSDVEELNTLRDDRRAAAPASSATASTYTFEELEKIRYDSHDFIAKIGLVDRPKDDIHVFNIRDLEMQDTFCQGVGFAPIFSNAKIGHYALLCIESGSKFGPFINTGGLMVVICLDIEDYKVFWSSQNLKENQRVTCCNQVHALVLPDDIFNVENKSNKQAAKILLVACPKTAQPTNYLQHLGFARQLVGAG